MSALLVVVACLAAGAVLGRGLDPAPFQRYLLDFALPALALHAVHRLPTVSTAGVASVWLVFAAATVGFVALGRVFGWSRATVGCLALSCGLSNTSFVGFPLLEALLGPDAVALAVPIDQLGSFLLVCTLAPVVAGWAAGRTVDARSLALRVVRFPALWAMSLALLLHDVPFPAVLDGALDRIGTTLSPVALFAVGAQLRRPPRTDLGPLGVGLVVKLGLAPLGVLLALGHTTPAARVAVLEAAMAPMVTGVLLAQSFGLRPDLASACLGVGVPLSLVTVWGWTQLVS